MNTAFSQEAAPAMTMVIECEACQSRFRLDERLFKGSRAIRVRCRKCGGPIVALNPDIPEWMYAEEKAPFQRAAPAEAPREEPAAAPEPPPKVAAPASRRSSADDAATAEAPQRKAAATSDAPREDAEPGEDTLSKKEASPAEDASREGSEPASVGLLEAPVAAPDVPKADVPSTSPPPDEVPLPFRLEEEPPLQFDRPADVPAESGGLATTGEAMPVENAPPVDDVPREAAENAFEGWIGGRWVTLDRTPLPPWVEEEPPLSLAPPTFAGSDGSERSSLSGEEANALLSELIEPDPSELYPAPPEGSETVITAIDDLFAAAPAAGSARSAASVEEKRPRRFTPPLPAAMPAPERPPYTRPLFLAGVALWLLLLAGGALFFGTGGTGGKLGRSLQPSEGSEGSSHTRAGVYEVRDVRWETVRKTDAGDLFVVRGTVVNAGSKESGGIRIQATLVGTDNQALGERDVFAANVIDDTTLRHASQTVLKGVLNKRFGDGERNKDIPPGASVPFMVVFFDPPADIGSILVKGVDAP